MQSALGADLVRAGKLGQVVARVRRRARSLRRRLAALALAARVAARRTGTRLSGLPPRDPLPSWNTLFRRDRLPRLRREKLMLESFDAELMARLNEKRLRGQILFEYGTLLNAIPTWTGLSVLDIGTGGGRLPRWMAAQGAAVVCFDYPRPVERPAHSSGDAVTRRGRRKAAPLEVSWVKGDMLELPFASGSFDLVTSLSVIEHLDTDLADRRYVPYAEQRMKAQRALSEMVRVTRTGGTIYLTSDCCDYSRTTSDAWRPYYYFVDGPALSGAWPSGDVQEIFYDYLTRQGCTLMGRNTFAASEITGDPNFATFRGPFFSCFSVLARKLARDAAA